MYDPLERIRVKDNALYTTICRDRELAFSAGAIPARYKLLIAMALDALEGSVSGVRALATQALKHGASSDEILETLRIAHYIGGVATTYIAAEALQGVLGGRDSDEGAR